MWLILMALWSVPAGAAPRLQLVAGEPQAVFAGTNRVLNLCWRNAGQTVNETEIHSRTMQLTSATAVCVGEAPWKKLQMLPGQTVLESAALDFPPVRARTRFLIQWCDGASNVLGATDVLVYPTNLLAELGVLMNHDENALGVYDPENELKPLLKNLKVGFVDLENMVAENFRGKLAIVGAFESKSPARTLTTSQINRLAKHGVAIVWMQPRADNSELEREEPQPTFYCVPADRVGTVVVQPETVAGLAGNPRSQLNLIFFCKLALHPQSPSLPVINNQP
jgi:hypothetical protein